MNEQDLCENVGSVRNILKKDNEYLMVDVVLVKLLDIYKSKSAKKYYDEIFETLKFIVNNVNSWFAPYIAKILHETISNSTLSHKKYSYMLLLELIKSYPDQIKITMPYLIPMVATDVNDVVMSVKESATETLELILKCSGNMDLDAFIPVVLKGIKSPNTIYDSIESLASCVFVQNVEAPALSVTGPKASKATTIPANASIVVTAIAIPNNPAKLYVTIIPKTITSAGRAVDSIETAKP